jgi:hypothetical protein
MSNDTAPRKSVSPSNFEYSAWQPQYEAVLSELNMARLAHGLAAAEGAIFFRLKAISDNVEHDAERKAIADAACVNHDIRREKFKQPLRQKEVGANVASHIPQAFRPATTCYICDKLVSLKTAKTDEQGLSMHEECYVARLANKMEGIRHPKESA